MGRGPVAVLGCGRRPRRAGRRRTRARRGRRRRARDSLSASRTRARGDPRPRRRCARASGTEEFAQIMSRRGRQADQVRTRRGRRAVADLHRLRRRRAGRSPARPCRWMRRRSGEGKLAFTLRLPIGIVGAISPFNFPLNLVAHKLAPALAAGCPVVLKPAPATPLTALLLAEVTAEAGLPAGWLSVVCGPAQEIGDVLVDDDAREGAHVHGSGPVGWEPARARVAQAGRARAGQLDADDRRRRRRPRARRDAAAATYAFALLGTGVHLAAAHLRRTARCYDAFVAPAPAEGRGARRRRPRRRRDRRRSCDRRAQPRPRARLDRAVGRRGADRRDADRRRV